MNKDNILIAKSDGTSEEMEVVATFRLEESSKNIIIYKELDNDKYYAASYNERDDSNYTDLNTDFTDKEKEQLNKLFDKLIKGGEINARV